MRAASFCCLPSIRVCLLLSDPARLTIQMMADFFLGSGPGPRALRCALPPLKPEYALESLSVSYSEPAAPSAPRSAARSGDSEGARVISSWQI